MNFELGAFALRQLLTSTVVVGPILILIGLCYYLFKQDRRSVIIYLSVGIVFTIVGAFCLYLEFKTEARMEQEKIHVESVKI